MRWRRYLTPAGNQGFAPHYDTHDVFVAQVHGSKIWRLAGAPYPLPMQSQPHDKSQPAPEPLQELELRTGDLLYLPRGTIHSAVPRCRSSSPPTTRSGNGHSSGWSNCWTCYARGCRPAR